MVNSLVLGKFGAKWQIDTIFAPNFFMNYWWGHYFYPFLGDNNFAKQMSISELWLYIDIDVESKEATYRHIHPS